MLCRSKKRRLASKKKEKTKYYYIIFVKYLRDIPVCQKSHYNLYEILVHNEMSSKISIFFCYVSGNKIILFLEKIKKLLVSQNTSFHNIFAFEKTKVFKIV